MYLNENTIVTIGILLCISIAYYNYCNIKQYIILAVVDTWE